MTTGNDVKLWLLSSSGLEAGPFSLRVKPLGEHGCRIFVQMMRPVDERGGQASTTALVKVRK